MKTHLRTHLHASQRGLTLLELLIVLGLIAVLSSVALRSVAGLFEEKRYEANLSQMEAIDLAVRGTVDASGFVGDIGRLPLVQGSTPETMLAELWEESALTAYSIQTAAGDGEVKLGVGWRGPYLEFGLTRDSLYDGFGNTLLFYQQDGSLAANGDPIAIVQSVGADNAPGGTDFNEDQSTVFEADATAVSLGLAPAPGVLWRTPLTVQVTPESGQIDPANGALLLLRVYGADGNGNLVTIEESTFNLSVAIPSHTFVTTALPHGAKVFRVYQTSTAPGDVNSPIVASRRSAASTVKIARSSTNVGLTLF